MIDHPEDSIGAADKSVEALRLHRLRSALRHWVTWTTFVDEVADARYRIEDINGDASLVLDICQRAGLKRVDMNADSDTEPTSAMFPTPVKVLNGATADGESCPSLEEVRDARHRISRHANRGHNEYHFTTTWDELFHLVCGSAQGPLQSFIFVHQVSRPTPLFFHVHLFRCIIFPALALFTRIHHQWIRQKAKIPCETISRR